MTDFLLELRSEEIPARMQAKARDDLARLTGDELKIVGLHWSGIVCYSTPRRLAVIVQGLPVETEPFFEELKGPRASAPPQALEGFLRKTGLRRDQLVDRDGVLFAVIDRPGRATHDVLAEAIPAIIRAFPWPKSMRWGYASVSTESLRWVRPLQGIVALFGGDVVPCEVAGIASGRATVGHRFMASGHVSILSPDSYAAQLRDAHVIVDQDERAAIIRTRATDLARAAGLDLIEDEGLVAENAGLTEWPVPLLGRFDDAFLSVPPEVIQLTARVNQKYFVCRTGDGALANAFICTANIDAVDGGAKIVEGNRKVLAARLSDARFFYETDLKVPLEEQAKKLEKIVFHEKLGTVADKVARVAKLARWLVEAGIVPAPSALGREGQPLATPPVTAPLPTLSPQGRGLADLAERAARLAKADLVTGMVGEFPELQGVMGGYYATAQGEDPRVAAAIRDHYKPVGAGDDVPTESVTVAVSLADKLDTLASFFAIDELPTGSKDPFALRRAALGILAIIQSNGLRLELAKTAAEATSLLLWQAADENRAFTHDGDPPTSQLITSHPESFEVDWLGRDWFVMFGSRRDPYYGSDDEMAFLGSDNSPYPWKRYDALNRQFSDFFADRLKVQQREAGVRHDLIDAVFALGGEDDLVRLLARVHALQSFITTDDGANLLAGYKRAANILKKEGVEPSPQTVAPAQAGAFGDGAGSEPPAAPAFAGATEDGMGATVSKPLSYTPEIAEAALIAALDAAEPAAAAAVAREDFEGAMAALASLRAPIDAFFDNVTVNDSDPAKRAARLALLARVRDAVHAVADFSRIEG